MPEAVGSTFFDSSENIEELGPKGLRDSSSFKDFETKLHGSPNPVLKNQDCGLAYVQKVVSSIACVAIVTTIAALFFLG